MDNNLKEDHDIPRSQGRYANHFEIGHNVSEFVIDFIQTYPENGHGKFHTRIITIPEYAKNLLETLGESIALYEKTYGKIERKEGMNHA